MSNLDGILPAPNPAKAGNTRAVTHGLYAKTPLALQQRQEKVSALVEKMYAKMPWLDEVDRPHAEHWAQLEVLGETVFANLCTRGITTGRRSEPRRLLGEFRALRRVQLDLGDKLGMTPASRMVLRVNATRAKAFAHAMQEARQGGPDA